MTGARKAKVAATFTLEFDCARACQVEMDLEDTHVRFTLGQMIARAGAAHDDAHAADPVSAFRWHDDTVVRAMVPAVAR